MFCQFIGRSSAMIADGIHSFSDFVTDLVVIVFVAYKPPYKQKNFRPKDESLTYVVPPYFTNKLASNLITPGIR